MHSEHSRQSRAAGRPSLSALLVAATAAIAIAVAVVAAPVEAKIFAQEAADRSVARSVGTWSPTTPKSDVKRHEGRSVRISARRKSRSIAIVSKPVAAPFAGSSRALIQLRSARPRTRLCVRVERGWKAGTIARSCVTVGRAWRGASVRVLRLAQGQRVRLSIRAGAASRGPLFEIRNARMRFTPAARRADPLPCSSKARRSSPACGAPPPAAPAQPPAPPASPPTTPPPAVTPPATTAPTSPPPAASAPSSPVSCDRVAAPNGSDSATGTLEAPFLTAQRLASSLVAGQTGCLRGGTYDVGSTYVLDLSTGGIHVRSYPGERARLVGVVHVRSSAAGSRLSQLDFEGDGTMNAIKIYAADVTVEDSDITSAGRGWSCLMLGSNAGAGQATRVIVRRNRFHHCGSTANTNKDHAIYAQNVADGQITGNVFWNSAAYAIQLYPNAQRTVFAHNVIDGDTPSIRGGVVFGGDSSYASSDNVVEQNVIAHSASSNITSSWGSRVGTGNVARNNCVWGAAQGEIETGNGGFSTSGNLVADPRFRDRARRDYRLGTASPCLALVGYDAAAMLLQ